MSRVQGLMDLYEASVHGSSWAGRQRISPALDERPFSATRARHDAMRRKRGAWGFSPHDCLGGGATGFGWR
jgi:hypothetical protein